MKHIQRKTMLLGSVLGVAAGLFAGALMLGERLSSPVSGLCFGLAGILGGVAGSRLIMARVERSLTPEERKEIERGGAGRAKCDHPGEGGLLQLVLEPVPAVGVVAADPGDPGRDVCGLCVGGHRAALYLLHGQCRALGPADVSGPVPGGPCAGKHRKSIRMGREHRAVSEYIPFSPGGDAAGGR